MHSEIRNTEPPLFRPFLAKLLVLLLVFQSLAIAAPQAQPSARHSRPPSQPASQANPQQKARRAPVQPFAALPTGARPKYLPVSPADPADPYIVSQASALNNDANQIFAFVRDQIGFEAYVGSVRGARGTLWSMAGNTLDKASLLIALLGAAGYTAQYEHAGGGADAANLISSMFPHVNTFVGCVPPNTGTDDPAQNGAAQAATADYFWVQYGSNGSNTIALDPNVPGAQPGQSFQTPGATSSAPATFTSVPANLRQEVTIKINAELYSQASSIFAGPPATTNVLTETFDASALVGNVITAGNLVSVSAVNGLDVTATTYTYTPFLLVGSGGPDITQDQVITGTPYQELFTNFPLSSQLLTGLFLEIDADDTTGTPQTYTHTMFDRLGPAARQGNAPVSLSLPTPPAPAVSQFDLTTVNILTSRQPLSTIQAQQTRLTNAYNNYEAIKAQLNALPSSGPLTDAQQQTLQQGSNLGEYLEVAENELIAMTYNQQADVIAQQLQTGYYSRVYPNSPRLTIAAASYNGGNSREMIDVLKNDMFVIDGAGQNHNAPYWEEVERGVLESLTESAVLNQATGQTNAVGIGEVFGALGNPNLLTIIAPGTNGNPSNPQALSATTLSPDAQTLILNDVAAGNAVMTPNQMVTVNGASTVGWWETNLTTGHTISHFANGGHQALVEEFAVELFADLLQGQIRQFIGTMEGFGFAGIEFANAVLQGVAAGNLKVTKAILANPPALGNIQPPPNLPPLQEFLNNFASNISGEAGTIIKSLEPGGVLQFANDVNGFQSNLADFENGLANGYYQGLEFLAANLPGDPDVLQFISTPLGLPAPTLNPGSSPGVQIGSIAVDSTYTMGINGNHVPLVFDLPISNIGPSTDTFRIQTVSTPDFQIYPTVGSLTLQGGESGKVNICVVPWDGSGSAVPAVGQGQNYSVTVTSISNPAFTASASPSFNTPPLPSLGVSTYPLAVATNPGGSVAVNLTLASEGNVAPGAVGLTATIPAGITITGLTSPLNVPANGTATDALTIRAAGNLPVGEYDIPIVATFTPAGGTAQFFTYELAVSVTALGACAVTAATAATQLGKPSLGADLLALEGDMDIAAASPANTALASRVVGDMNTILNQELTASYFQSVTPGLTTATSAVAAASTAALPGALSNLSSAICSLASLLNQANSTSTSLSLIPTPQLNDTNLAIGPNQSAQWNISITNNSSVLHVYDLSATGVPAGVSVQFSQPSISVPPYPASTHTTSSALITLTTGATFNTPFSFDVVATPEDAPAFAVSAPGTLLARPQSVNIDQITSSPAYVTPGGSFTISARVFSVVNETVTAPVTLSFKDPNGNACCGSYEQTLTLTPANSIQTVTFPAINTTTDWLTGVYQVFVSSSFGGYALGATATGSLVVGSPISGTLTATPAVTPPGSSTVQAALNITRDSVQNPISTLVGSVPLTGLPRAMTLFQNGAQQLAYVCSDSLVSIVDVTNPASPSVLSTFAHDILTTEDGSPVAGYQVMACSIYSSQGSSYLLISYSRYDGNTSAGPIPTHFATYSLASPLSPAMVGSVVDIQRGDSAGLYITGNTGLMVQSTNIYDPHNGIIFQETGDVWTANLSNAGTNGTVSYLNDVYSCGTFSNNTCSNVTNVPAGSSSGGVCTVTGTTPVPNGQTSGGPYRIGVGTAVTNTTSYFASTNANGTNIESPTCPPISGQLLVVDTTNPSNPNIVTSVAAPEMAFMTGVAVQGNVAVAVGDSTGIQTANGGYLGTLVISSFDVTSPTSPQLLNSVSTQLSDAAGSFVISLGSNTFAVGNTTLNGTPQLVLVDASNPDSLRYIPYQAAFVANPTVAQGGYFFALSSTPASSQNALSIFQLSDITGPQLSVSLVIPSTGNATPVAGSFNPAPSSSTPGANYTTYTWNQPAQNTIQWTMHLAGVNPGDVTTLVNSGQLNFTLPTYGAATYQLEPLTVLTGHILSITPSTQSVANAGVTANYTATISNPLSSQQTFNLSAIVPSGWSGVVPANVTVGANGSQSFNVAITPPVNAQNIGTLFNVAAATAGGIADSVPGFISVNSSGPNLGGNGNGYITAFTSSISPGQVTVGRGDSTPYTIAVTNSGNIGSSVQVNPPSSLPTGLSVGSYTPASSVTLSQNAAAAMVGAISASATTAPGPYSVTIPVQQGANSQDVTLGVVVSSSGVQGSISPSSGTPASTYMLSLTNTGLTPDTFQLSVVGPLAQAASVPATVTLAAGATNASIPITLKSVNYILPSNSQLQIKAVSRNDPNAFALVSATMAVPTGKSVTASIAPSLAYVSSTPSAVTLAFNANNTGNVADSYKAAITGTTGAVSATLGNAGNAFIIPALGGAQLPLNATLTSGNSGTVTVTITSTSNSSVNAQSTVTIAVGTPSSCDVNADQHVNVQDVQLMIDEALGINPPANDLNADGVVNVVDVQIDLNAALQLPCLTGAQGTMSVTSAMRPARSMAPSAGGVAAAGNTTPVDRVVDLGTLGGDITVAYGLNNLGQVAGSSETGKFGGAASPCPRCPIRHAFLWEAGHMTDLGIAIRGGQAGSTAYAINDAREAAGTFTGPEGLASSFVYENGAIMPLDGVPLARIHALNNTGQRAGEFSPETAAATHAFLWRAGALTDLGMLGGSWSQALALNDSGQVAGTSRLAGDSATHAFLYDGVGLRDLGTLGGKNSAAYGINSGGQVVGESMTAAGLEHAFLYSDGSMADLGTLGGASSRAIGINSAGVVAGWSLTASGERHAFLWLSGRMVDLNSVVNPGSAVWLEEAAAVNDLGQIVANGNNGHAYLISLPIPLQ